MRPTVNLFKLGRVSYIDSLKIQKVLFENLKNAVVSQYNRNRIETLPDGDHENFGSCHLSGQRNLNSLIIVEHEPVYTIGIRSKGYCERYALELQERLAEHNLKANLVKTNRGGLITFHGPGQLVAYPIIYLGHFNHTIKNRSVKSYVNLLEATIIDTLSRVGVHEAHTVREYPGVWVDNGERKIAFVGIACSRYVTMHGISINFDCDISWFDHIVSCGIEGKMITSVRQELLSSNNHRKTQFKGINMHYTSTNVIQPASLEDVSTHDELYIDNEESNSDRCNLSSGIDSISEAFCNSFSQHFDCKLEIKSFDPTATN